MRGAEWQGRRRTTERCAATVRLIAFALLALMLPGAGGAASSSAASEIARLLNILGASPCQFYRNGSWYSAAEAQAHLQKKYDYLAGKGQVTTAEEFIARAATSSSVSSVPYRVRCPNQATVPSAEWLGNQLARLRAGETPTPPR